jgi:aminopeptidase N
LTIKSAIPSLALPFQNGAFFFTGFYRVNYDLRNWKLLTEYLMDRDRFTQIGIINRAQLLDDSLNLARAGLLDYATALNVTRYLANELEYIPWKAALNALGYIDSMLIKTGNYDKFKVCIFNV